LGSIPEFQNVAGDWDGFDRLSEHDEDSRSHFQGVESSKAGYLRKKREQGKRVDHRDLLAAVSDWDVGLSMSFRITGMACIATDMGLYSD